MVISFNRFVLYSFPAWKHPDANFSSVYYYCIYQLLWPLTLSYPCWYRKRTVAWLNKWPTTKWSGAPIECKWFSLLALWLKIKDRPSGLSFWSRQQLGICKSFGFCKFKFLSKAIGKVPIVAETCHDKCKKLCYEVFFLCQIRKASNKYASVKFTPCFLRLLVHQENICQDFRTKSVFLCPHSAATVKMNCSTAIL